MSEHLAKAQALAAKITSRAESELDGLKYLMRIMNWSPEYRAIMWHAVIEVASRYAAIAKAETKSNPVD